MNLLETLISAGLTAGGSGAVVAVNGTAARLTPQAGKTYQCGVLSTLTLADPPAAGAYTIIFTSGAAATTTTIPTSVLGLESFAAAANTVYEINVLDSRAVVGSWAVSA